MSLSTLTDLKGQVDFRVLVERSYAIGRSGKINCPFHNDQHPSCHIYPNGYKCFGCGVYGDHIEWLEQIEGFTTADAVRHLRELSGEVYTPHSTRPPTKRVTEFSAIRARDYERYMACLRATHQLPRALAGRGLSLEEALQLGLAALGDDVLIPIFGPSGAILALKQRFFRPRSEQRYVYTTAGQGSPAWCSPGFLKAAVILVVEGELNGVVAYLALRDAGTDVAVMGVAGTYGHLHEAALKDKQVYVWADDDAPGRQARKRWLAQARRVAKKAKGLPGRREDACEIAASKGRLYLASWLLEAMHTHSKRRSSRKKELLWSS